MEAIDLVYTTWEQYRDKEFDWSNFTATQRAIIDWIENEWLEAENG